MSPVFPFRLEDDRVRSLKDISAGKPGEGVGPGVRERFWWGGGVGPWCVSRYVGRLSLLVGGRRSTWTRDVCVSTQVEVGTGVFRGVGVSD